MVGRWGTLWKALQVSINKATQAVIVCCRLHNFIIEESGSAGILQNELSDVLVDFMGVNLQVEYTNMQSRRRDKEDSNFCDVFIEQIEEFGLKRSS